mmetsp:Transcript_28187/g.62765  ORF Transcript_28187/g.62765 Transcript_28187/m.62765 type:complete len:917 (-) Transcript_28187:87-2837(-)
MTASVDSAVAASAAAIAVDADSSDEVADLGLYGRRDDADFFCRSMDIDDEDGGGGGCDEADTRTASDGVKVSANARELADDGECSAAALDEMAKAAMSGAVVAEEVSPNIGNGNDEDLSSNLNDGGPPPMEFGRVRRRKRDHVASYTMAGRKDDDEIKGRWLVHGESTDAASTMKIVGNGAARRRKDQELDRPLRQQQQQQDQDRKRTEQLESDGFFTRSLACDEDSSGSLSSLNHRSDRSEIAEGANPVVESGTAVSKGSSQKSGLRQRREQQQHSKPPSPFRAGKLRKRGSNIWNRSSSKSISAAASTSSSAASASTVSTAFFSRSVRSMVDSLSPPTTGAFGGIGRRFSGGSKGFDDNASPAVSMPNPVAAAAPTDSSVAARLHNEENAPPADASLAKSTPRNLVNDIVKDGLATPTGKLANRKRNGNEKCSSTAPDVPVTPLNVNFDQSDYGNEGDEPLRTPRSVYNAAESMSTPPTFLFSSPEKIRPIARVASAATVGLKNSIQSVSHSPAVSKAVQFGKRRSSEMIQRRRARRASAIKARLARIERLKAEGKYSPIIIPADHPVKIAWDVLTIILTILSALRTHQSIRDRAYEQSPFVVFTEFWFILDIMLNFFCEHKTSSGEIIRDGKAVWARYLTTWFVIDALSVVPWERIYVRPIVERQKRRNFFTKTFFRSKAVVRVTRILRGRHVKLFGRVAKQTKTVGVGGQRLLRLIIKYVPKYLLFYRNMRSVLVVRTLRQVHFLRKLWKSFVVSIRREPLGVLRRPGIVFAAASAEWAGEEDWDYEELHDDDLDGDGDDDVSSNSLLDSEGDTMRYQDDLDADELEDIHETLDLGRRNLFGGEDIRGTVLLPSLDNDLDHHAPPKRDRSLSEGLANGATTSSSSPPSSGGLRFRRSSSKLELAEQEALFGD